MKKSSRVISTLLLGATLTTLSANVFAVESKETIEKKLLAGNNRYETAVKVSEKWEKADNVVLVNALAMADALAATPLAKLKDAPILLTDAGELTKATKERIEKLGAKNVFVVGGEGVVSKAVVAELEKAGLKVERISGVDRFETSAKVAKELDAKKVAVVNGLNGRLADALSVAAPAAENNMAILLTNGKDLGAVKDAAKDKEAVVVGGSAVVADSIKSDLKAERLGGANRNETNAEVMKKFYGDKQVKSVYVAKDGAAQENQLVDALAAGPVAGKEGAPIVLAGSKLADGQKKFLEGQGEVATVYEVGGGINTSTVKDLMTALGVKDVVDKAEVSSVKATNLREVVVTFGMKVDIDSAEDAKNYSLNKGATIEDAVLQEDGKTVILKVKENENGKVLVNQEKYKLTVDKVFAGDKEILSKDIEFTPIDNTLPEVKEVKSLGTKAIKVVLSEPAKVAKANNFKLDGKSFHGNVKNNGRELILTPYENSVLSIGEHKLSVEGVEDYATLKSLASEHAFTVVEDKTPPTIEKAVATLEKVTITFSEDIDEDTVKASNVYYKKSDSKIKAADYKKVNGTTYTFYFEGDNRLPAYETTLYVEGVKDYSGNEITETKKTIKAEVDQVRPVVKSVDLDALDSKKINIKFSKAIKGDKDKNIDPKYFTIKDDEGDKVGVDEVSVDGRIVTVTLYKALPVGKNTIKISGLKDNTYLENVMEDYEGVINADDKTAPEKPSYSVNPATRTVVLTFKKEMDASTLTNPNNYFVKSGSQTRSLPSDTEISVIQSGKAVKLILPEYFSENTKLIFGSGTSNKDKFYIDSLSYMGLKDKAGNVVEGYSDDVPLTETLASVSKVKAKDRKTIEVTFNQSIVEARRGDFALKLDNKDVSIDEVKTDGTDVVVIKLNENLKNTNTDLLKLTINKESDESNVAADLRTSSGTKVTAQANIEIEDKMSPEVVLPDNKRYTVNNNKVEIDFTEELKHTGNDDKDALLLEQYKGDLRVTDLNGKALNYDLEFGDNYSTLCVVINPEKEEVKTEADKKADEKAEVLITIKSEKDGKARFIQDVKGNEAKEQSEVRSNGKVVIKTYTVKAPVDPAAGAKAEAAKLTAEAVTFAVDDTDKEEPTVVTEAAVAAAQSVVGEGYTVTKKQDGTIADNKLTVTFVVAGTDATNTVEKELVLTIGTN